MKRDPGAMRERLQIQSPDPVAVSVSILTSAATTATATTATNHGYATGDYVTMAGGAPAGYNGRVAVTVTGAKTFTYAVAAGLATPATGTITATYASDAQGGQKPGWTTLGTIPAQALPIGGLERLQAQAIQAIASYRFRVRAWTSLTPKCRALWTPAWPPGSAQKTLEIHAVLPDLDSPLYMRLECAEVAS